LAGDGAGWGRCLHLRVHIDLTKPLERGRALHLGGQSYWVMFKYEKLPMFCFSCGRVVHGRLGCLARREATLHAAAEKKEWGTWLRVEVRRLYFQSEGGGQARRSRLAEEHSPEGSGSVDRQFHLRPSSFSGRMREVPQARNEDKGECSGHSGTCGRVEASILATGGGSKSLDSPRIGGTAAVPRSGDNAALPRSAGCDDHVADEDHDAFQETNSGVHNPIYKRGVQQVSTVDPTFGGSVQEVTCMVGVVSSHVYAHNEMIVENVGGMQTLSSTKEVDATHVHSLSDLFSENVDSVTPIPCADALDSIGRDATKSLQHGVGNVRKWKRQARGRRPTSVVSASVSTVTKKRRVRSMEVGQQGVAASKKCRKLVVDSYQTLPTQAEADSQSRLAL
jgi:hypothetical protein